MRETHFWLRDFYNWTQGVVLNGRHELSEAEVIQRVGSGELDARLTFAGNALSSTNWSANWIKEEPKAASNESRNGCAFVSSRATTRSVVAPV